MDRSMWIAIWFGTALASTPAAAADQHAVINLGGLRRVRATVKRTEDDYWVQVRMLPVSCFDAATNARLNREKAEQYAFQGLARFLSGDKVVRFSVAGARVEKTGKDGKFHLLTLMIPRSGVVRLDAESETPPRKQPEKQAVRIAFDAPLFLRKREHRNTLEQLAADLAQELRAAERRADENAKQCKAFPLAVAELEERGEANFEKLRSVVDGDKLLLTIEKDELVAEWTRRREQWRQQLRQAVKKHENKTREKPQ